MNPNPINRLNRVTTKIIKKSNLYAKHIKLKPKHTSTKKIKVWERKNITKTSTFLYKTRRNIKTCFQNNNKINLYAKPIKLKPKQTSTKNIKVWEAEKQNKQVHFSFTKLEEISKLC